MDDSRIRRPFKQLDSLESGSAGAGRPEAAKQMESKLHGNGAAPGDLAQPRLKLDVLEAELAYRGRERRHGSCGGLAKLLASVLDEVDYGLVLIAADGHVVHANHAARTELVQTKSFELVGRHLVGRTTADQHALDDALMAARYAGRRKMLSFNTDDALSESKPCALSIVPLPAALSAHHLGNAVLIALPRSRIAETLSVDAYARKLGLTRRQQEVLGCLCEGQRVREIAVRLEIGEETVRSHVKQLKVKTGCNGTVDIVNQLSRLPPMVGALRAMAADNPQ